MSEYRNQHLRHFFQTQLVTFKLLASDNSELAGQTMYYASGWKQFGSGTSTTIMELLPVNHKFRITYGGARQEKWQTHRETQH